MIRGTAMKVFVGLGNPGSKYAGNRHNVGFMAVDRIAEMHGFQPWRGRFQGQTSEGRLGSQKVLLLKPETFMNRSGQSVGEAMRFYKLDPADLTVFHDEIDLAPGKLRVKSGGGHAGHNGLRSIHDHIGPHYDRVRIGVGHPGRKEAVAGYVLHDFAKADMVWLDALLQGIGDGAPALADEDPGRFMNAVALRVAPPRSSTSSGGGKGGSKGSGKTEAGKTQKKTPPRPADRHDAAAGDGSAPEGAPQEEARSALQRLVDRFR